MGMARPTLAVSADLTMLCRLDQVLGGEAHPTKAIIVCVGSTQPIATSAAPSVIRSSAWHGRRSASQAQTCAGRCSYGCCPPRALDIGRLQARNSAELGLLTASCPTDLERSDAGVDPPHVCSAAAKTTGRH